MYNTLGIMTRIRLRGKDPNKYHRSQGKKEISRAFGVLVECPEMVLRSAPNMRQLSAHPQLAAAAHILIHQASHFVVTVAQQATKLRFI